MSPYRKILVALDESPCSMKAAKEGFALAAEMAAEVILVHVLNPVQNIGHIDAGYLPSDEQAILKERAESLLNTAEMLAKPGTGVEKRFPEGKPVKVIPELANELGVGLIVMGSHCHKGLSRLVLGSVAEAVLRHSSVPVLIVPSGND